MNVIHNYAVWFYACRVREGERRNFSEWMYAISPKQEPTLEQAFDAIFSISTNNFVS